MIGPVQVSLTHWVSLLSQVTQSQITKSRKYLIQKSNSLEISNLKIHPERLSIRKIVDISISQLKVLKEAYTNGSVENATFLEEFHEISHLTDQLVNARVAKHDQIFKVLGRLLARIISVCASVFGISLFKSIELENDNFKREILFEKSQLKSSVRECEIAYKQAQIKKQTDKIPQLLTQLSQLVSKSDIEDWLKNQISKSKQHFDSFGYISQFKNDIERQLQFKRKDRTLNIHDTSPLPAHTDSKVQEGIKQLRELVTSGDDKEWEYILQAVCSQTSLNSLFDGCITLFNLEAANHQWEEDGKNFKLELKFSDVYPPIEITVNRDPISKLIEKIDVRVNGKLDVRQARSDNQSESFTHLRSAIQGNLFYTVTLNEAKQMIITVHEANLNQN